MTTMMLSRVRLSHDEHRAWYSGDAPRVDAVRRAVLTRLRGLATAQGRAIELYDRDGILLEQVEAVTT